MRIETTVETDVLVIGGGGAGLRAALASCDAGARTSVVLKGRAGRSGATVSPDSPGAAWQAADGCSGGTDSPDVHCQNILDAGLGMARPKLARILATETVDRTRELERWGLRFIPDPQGLRPHYCGYSCFGDQPRAHAIRNSGFGHAGDVVRVLLEQLRTRTFELYENVLISDLVVAGGRCAGAVAVGPDGQITVFKAGAVVLAAGGARQIYPAEPGRSRIDTTGDSYAMALRAGAALTNMEFTQYMLHPIAPFPVSVPGVFWSLCPRLKNKWGDDALASHLPPGVDWREVMVQRTLHYPFSSRDPSRWLDIAFAIELREGRGTDQGGLYLDFSEVDPASFQPSRPQHLPDDPGRPVQLPDQPVQVRPAAHAINGGVLIDAQAQSTLPGLFAVAEAATGPHGADRLGGCMISNGQVFGARAGHYAARHALATGSRSLPPSSLERPLAWLHQFGRGRRKADDVLAALQEAAGRQLVVLRNQRGLESLAGRIQELAEQWLPQVRVSNARLLRRAIEVGNSLSTADLMTRAALLREESRGSHYREDFPRLDDRNWRVNIVFRRTEHGLRANTQSLETPSRDKPAGSEPVMRRVER